MHEYEVTGGFVVTVLLDPGVHVTPAPKAFVTVHVMVPPGTGLPLGPVTNAVRVKVPPSVGVPVDVKVTVGVRVEIPCVTEFDEPPT